MFSPFLDFTDRFRLMDDLERQVDRMLALQSGRAGAVPWMSLRDAGEALVLVADLPGISEKDIDITIEQDVLTLRAEGAESAPKGYKTVRAERPKVRFQKQIELPVRVDAERAEASSKDGVLTLTLPKAASALPRKIAVAGAAKQNAPS